MSEWLASDIGAFPTEWRVVRFDEAFTVQQGKQVSQRHRHGANQRPFLRTKNILWGRVDLSEVDAMNFTGAEEQRLALQAGDLLICEGGDIGRTAMWNDELSDCYYQNHLHRARVRADVADPRFAMYWLWYAFAVGSVYTGRGNVTTIPNLSQSKLAELPFPLPSLDEQRMIGEVLTVVQKAIDEQRRLLTLTDELKKAVLFRLFPAGLHGRPLRDTPVGAVPDDWQVVPLRECAVVQTGVAKGRKLNGVATVTLPYLRVANVQSGYLDLSEMKTITVREVERARFALRVGDVVLTEGGDFDKLGRGFVWNGEIADCLHQNHIFAIRVDRSRLLPEYLAHLSQSPYGKGYFLSVAHKTTNLACINTNKLKAFPILIPPIEEQREIVRILASIDEKLFLQKRRHNALTDLFRTILHDLMTAQIRLPSLDLSVLNAAVVA